MCHEETGKPHAAKTQVQTRSVWVWLKHKNSPWGCRCWVHLHQARLFKTLFGFLFLMPWSKRQSRPKKIIQSELETWTKTMNSQHMLQTRTLNLCHCPSESYSETKWTKSRLRSAPSSNMPDKLKHITSYQSSSLEDKHVSIKSLQEIHVRSAMFWGTGSIGKALPANVKSLGPSCKVDGHDIQTQPFPTACYCIYLQKNTAKEQGPGRRNIQSL